YIADIKALNHILVNDHIYQKGPIVHKVLTHLLGNGLLSVETAEHKSQRKILNPAFGVSQIRELTEIFNRKSVQLRDIWSCEIRKESGSSRLDVFGWLRKMTLDTVLLYCLSNQLLLQGFNYQFNALDPGRQPNDLEDAFTRFMHSPQAQPQTMLRLSQAEIPGLGFLPMPGGKTVKEARTKMVDIAKKLLSDSQADIKAGGVSGSKWGLLSLLVQSNTSHEIQENQRLSDAEVIAQIPTFFIAGHESDTATALALHALSVHPSVQSKLREELLTIATDDPTMDELNSLPYLENVVREVMHVYPPVGFSMREAVEDDVLPLSKSYLDRNGKSYDMLQIPKGTSIRIPISAVHRDKEIWGEDAAVFSRPERWDAIPAAAGGIPSVWGNLKTFLAVEFASVNPRPHNCIGFRFSLVEIKSLLFTFLRAFEFEAAVPADAVGYGATRPKVITEPKGETQLPLIVKTYNI
ncbi:cytochrome P450, partial [Mycena galopus ATCC 62051]